MRFLMFVSFFCLFGFLGCGVDKGKKEILTPENDGSTDTTAQKQEQDQDKSVLPAEEKQQSLLVQKTVSMKTKSGDDYKLLIQEVKMVVKGHRFFLQIRIRNNHSFAMKVLLSASPFLFSKDKSTKFESFDQQYFKSIETNEDMLLRSNEERILQADMTRFRFASGFVIQVENPQKEDKSSISGFRGLDACFLEKCQVFVENPEAKVTYKIHLSLEKNDKKEGEDVFPCTISYDLLSIEHISMEKTLLKSIGWSQVFTLKQHCE